MRSLPWLCPLLAALACAHPAPVPALPAPATTTGSQVATPAIGRSLVHDEDGSLRRVEEDVDGDGRSDVFTWLDGGNARQRQVDRDRDGRPDLWFWFGPAGLERVEFDRDRDGFRDRILYYRGGELRAEAWDDDGDGHCERRVEYEPGAQGELAPARTGPTEPAAPEERP